MRVVAPCPFVVRPSCTILPAHRPQLTQQFTVIYWRTAWVGSLERKNPHRIVKEMPGGPKWRPIRMGITRIQIVPLSARPDIPRGLLLKLEQGSNSRQYPGWPYAEIWSGPKSPVFCYPLRHYPVLSYEAGFTPRFIVLTPILLIIVRCPAEESSLFRRAAAQGLNAV